jgi:glycosyltransferase involved in cell wall biosynthesis
VNVLVTTEHRFFRTPDGAAWTNTTNSYEFWNRYRAVFQSVKVVARIRDVPQVDASFRRADGEGVRICPVPDYLGPWQYLAKARDVHRAVKASFDVRDAVIMRVSSHLAGCLEPELMRSGHPYGLEVVNDPFEVFAPRAVRYRLRPLFRWWFTRQLRRQCHQAAGVAYVTSHTLQNRYPCRAYSVGMSDVEIASDGIVAHDEVFTTHYSSVELGEDDSAGFLRGSRCKGARYQLVTVASLAQMYKAPDVLLRAVAECVRNGLNLGLTIVGDGRHRPELEKLAGQLGIADRVRFLGQLPSGAAVRKELDAADLFVLPSRSEGLPRAMVEAMARALPCIGTAVGGIPELLAPEDLVVPGDVRGLAMKIREVLSSPARMSAMSVRNLVRARDYRQEVLAVRRRAFFEHIRKVTSAWLSKHCGLANSSQAVWEGC